MAELAQKILPPGIGYDWTNMAYQEKKAASKGTITFVMAILVVILILAALYESRSDPIAVVLTVPLAVLWAGIGLMIRLTFRALRHVRRAIFPSMPRVVPHSVILPRCLEGLNVFCFVFFSCLSPAAYCSGKSRRNKAVAQFSRKNGTSIGSAQDR